MISAGRSATTASRIRDDILAGKPGPGTPLREVALAEKYDVSRRTVREALLDLTSEGLVTHRHNVGAVVRKLELDDVAELYMIRRMLESEGALYVPQASAEALESVAAACERYEVEAAKGIDSIALARADMAFHGAIIALTQSPRIDQFYATVSSQMTFAISILQRQDVANSVTAPSLVAEHRAIRDAVLSRDAQEAQRLAVEHTYQWEKALGALVEVGRTDATR